jgi:hypothetical protein
MSVYYRERAIPEIASEISQIENKGYTLDVISN